ncbi:methyl-accepting chemotaxis protein [Halodesulfovibrio sp.]|jgi:methyl-accepting chemotaxis protein|uniref:methyl-accepting chemotaxis protein n=1 Tax=Halodesulfovibrio sp. TaxID=1912772 RepID=UPI0025E6B7C3|nr:methyl-accepting chemotaxis protein [Halodesulfovibrio sp.]MCT4626351.1 methyl-accepting chemotaxis protein [Halodesulfovibrio sp.]
MAMKASLGGKISILIAVISFAVFSILIGTSTYLQRQAMLVQLSESLTQTSQLVQEVIERPMIIGDDEGTTEEFHRFHEKYPSMEIHLADYAGEITYSTKETSIDKQIASMVPVEGFSGLSRRALENPIKENLIVSGGDSPVFIRVVSIANSPSCRHCHGASKPILGQLVIAKDITGTMGTIQTQMFDNMAISFAGFIILVLSVMFFIRKVVIKPIEKITVASNSITNGDFHADFVVNSADELGDLSRNLGSMVEKLKIELGFSKGVLRGMTAPIVICDADRKLTSTNQEAIDLMGIAGSPADYKGVPVSEFIVNDPCCDNIIQDVMASHQPSTGNEARLQNFAGDELVLVFDAAPIYDLDGKMLGVFVMITDMTAMRTQQRRVEEQNDKITHAAESARTISEQVSSASEELAAQVRQSSNGADEQQRLTGESASAMTQMNASVLEVARNASDAAELAAETQEKAAEGGDIVEQAVNKIHAVAQQAQTLKKEMDVLGTRADGIGQIITVIEDIADQTNLLALNAAIEAARAGEAGRGFAVVADEVRKLAEKTMSATREVVEYVSAIQASTNQNVEATEKAVVLVGDSTELAVRSGEALKAILGMVEATADQVRAIAAASEEQSAASEQISCSVNVINDISEQTAAAMTESTAAVESVAQLAQDLNGIIDNMRS